MAAEESSSTDQQLTLDQFSFEKLLAAAWVLQCVQDQMHASNGRRSESFESVREVNESCARCELGSAIGDAILGGVTQADSRHEAPTARPVNHGALVLPR